jgi:hypothetical protein
MLRFFRIGFLFRKEFDFDIRLLLAGDEEGIVNNLSDPVCSGPYNQVTSQSFSQLRVSGDIVFNLFFDLVHVLHDAFSNLALLLYAPRFDTICFHDDQISSSFQLCDR